MSSIKSIILQLSSGLISETIIPIEYLDIPEINIAIINFNWGLRDSAIPGWIVLTRQINYSS
jgi:hypothetical protein